MIRQAPSLGQKMSHSIGMASNIRQLTFKLKNKCALK